MGPWTDLVLVFDQLFLACAGDLGQEELAGAVFDQSGQGAPARLAALSRLLISPWRTKKGGCLPRPARGTSEQPCWQGETGKLGSP